MKIENFKVVFVRSNNEVGECTYEGKYFKNLLDMRQNNLLCKFEVSLQNKKYQKINIYLENGYYLVTFIKTNNDRKVKLMSKNEVIELFN